MGLQQRERSKKKLEKQNALTVEQPVHSGTGKGEHTVVDGTRVVLPPKEVAGEREGGGCIQPRDYHKEQIQKVQEDEMNFHCRKEIGGFGHEDVVVVLQDGVGGGLPCSSSLSGLAHREGRVTKEDI